MNADLARTCADKPSLTLTIRLSNVRLIVSESTSVPVMNDTPSTTAIDVSTMRNLCARIPLIATFHMASYPPSFRIRSSTESAVGSATSATILPSARNTTRPA